MRSVAIAIVAVVALAAVHLATPRTSTATWPGGNGKILFLGSAGNSFETTLFTMSPDRTLRTELTNIADGVVTSGRYSPDGTRIVFQRRAAGTLASEVWVMDADGSDEEKLGAGRAPSWSPDGSRILFVREQPGGSTDLWTMDIDGDHAVRLTTANDAVRGAWSPDGTRILYVESGGGIWTIKPDGTNARLIRHTTLIAAAAWSPDGQRIAFSDLTAEPFTTEVFTMTASGGDVRNITGRIAALPVWLTIGSYSPDGTKILFSAQTRNSQGALQPGDMWVIDADGNGVAMNLAVTPETNEQPQDWQPAPPYPFADIAASVFAREIVWLEASGITSGCAPLRFCPSAPVTRAQMASFLVRAMDLPPTATDFFTDDEGSSHEADINALRAAGLTAGCTQTRYCPDAGLTRAQTASFLARSLELPSTSTNFFTDDEGSSHEADINRLAAAAITKGCAATTFCPDQVVTREQLAAFLRRSFDA